MEQPYIGLFCFVILALADKALASRLGDK